MKRFVLLFTLLLSLHAQADSGDLDVSWSGDGLLVQELVPGSIATATGMHRMTDGRVLVCGHIQIGADQDIFVARYAKDGTLDLSFSLDGWTTTPLAAASTDYAVAITILETGKILVAGSSDLGGGDSVVAVLRYKDNGDLDTTFDLDGILTRDVTAFPDFTTDMQLQKDGKILLSGFAGGDFLIIRMNVNGSYDKTFNTDGWNLTDLGGGNDFARRLVVQGDNKILLAGESQQAGGTDFALVRYTSSGNLNAGFDGDGIVITPVSAGADAAYAVVQQDDDQIIAAGFADDGDNAFALVRYNTDGTLDPSYDTDGVVLADLTAGSDEAYTLALQPDGKVLAAGRVNAGSDDIGIARFDGDGSLDASFGASGLAVIDGGTGGLDEVFALGVQEDGTAFFSGNNGNDWLVGQMEAMRADLNVSLYTSATSVGTRGLIDYQADVENFGPEAALRTVITFSLPDSAELIADSISVTSGTCTDKDDLISCTIDALAAGDVVTLSFTLRHVFEAVIPAQASASSPILDPDLNNNMSEVMISVSDDLGGDADLGEPTGSFSESESSGGGGCSLNARPIPSNGNLLLILGALVAAGLALRLSV